MNKAAARERNGLIGLICVLCVLPLVTGNVNIHHVMVMFLICIAGEAWNIITGLAGQTSFGHAFLRHRRLCPSRGSISGSAQAHGLA